MRSLDVHNEYPIDNIRQQQKLGDTRNRVLGRHLGGAQCDMVRYIQGRCPYMGRCIREGEPTPGDKGKQKQTKARARSALGNDPLTRWVLRPAPRSYTNARMTDTLLNEIFEVEQRQ
jgi:hypothetical protein